MGALAYLPEHEDAVEAYDLPLLVQRLLIELWRISLDHGVEEPSVSCSCLRNRVIHLRVVVLVEVDLLLELEAVLMGNVSEEPEVD